MENNPKTISQFRMCHLSLKRGVASGPLPTLPAGNLDSEERGISYSKPSNVPISRGGEVEDEAVPRRVSKR
jgi:hypothetical protein